MSDPTMISVMRDIRCGRCGFPLGETFVYDLVRDDELAVVARAKDGAINLIVCATRGCRAGISRPFLFIGCIQASGRRVGREGYEQSAEFAELVRQEAQSLLPSDDSFRAQGLSQLHDGLVRRAEGAVGAGD